MTSGSLPPFSAGHLSLSDELYAVLRFPPDFRPVGFRFLRFLYPLRIVAFLRPPYRISADRMGLNKFYSL